MTAHSADADLTALIDVLGKARVLVLGDVMLDRFTYGRVDRISPEAPIPVLRVERESAMLGGAGNVASNLAALGATVKLLSVCGADEAGAEVRRLLMDKLGDTEGLVPEAGRQTTTKIRFMAGGQQLLRADKESVVPVGHVHGELLIELAQGWITEVDVVVLSDYGKGVLTDEVVRRVIAAANASGKPVVVDPKGRDYARYRGATAITPNRRELSEASGIAVTDDTSAVAAAGTVIAKAGIGAVIATRSEEGMSVVTAGPDGSPAATHLRAEAREVFDVSGAGDTVVAALAAALGAGADLTMAARLANVAAGIVVAKVGTAVVRPEELRAACNRRVLETTSSKVAGLDAAMEQIARWRRMGQRIGFTNGCFDLLHPGHVSLLAQARAACDRLVVGLNSDASVRRLKGETRPVQEQTARATVLASLGAVDLVILFEEDTPLRLIESIRPDVLVKGADYTVETVVGADIVQSYGGRVMLAELTQGQSTTRMVERMKG
ncbi:D-glycero-beta-D-manno-heptose-7-phosphate kinase [Indioceanicola profundi]|uniref:D-glycero-beta-D-manno-heptose-7-phosphate kinase n=1 Tax=Indioceanicola profundi TaxID=2220096 RepID=UPI001CED8FF2|nr:D-glycero-beta-D-manno-heptose-7-phosphate kinase [Indioceanicola profundi]